MKTFITLYDLIGTFFSQLSYMKTMEQHLNSWGRFFFSFNLTRSEFQKGFFYIPVSDVEEVEVTYLGYRLMAES